MKIYTIAIFLFCIQISIALIEVSGVFDSNYAYNSQWVQEQGSIAYNESFLDYQVGGETDVSFSVGDFFKGLWLFIKSLAKTIIIFPYVLVQFGVPSFMAGLLSAPVYLVYIASLIQFIANRQFEGMS